MTEPNTLSKCHNAPVVTCEGAVWDIDPKTIKRGSTYYYGCTECREACDLQPPNTLDEYGIVGDLSDVKIPPQIKGKLEYHSTPNTDTLDEQIEEILEQHREWMRGIRTDRLVGTSSKEATQQLKALFTEHSKEVDRLARIDELKAVVVDFDERKLLTTGDTATQLITHGERIAQLKRNKGEDNE